MIEIRPFRNAWQVLESAGVQPIFLNQEQAIRLRHLPRVLSLWRDSRFGFKRCGRRHHSILVRRIEDCERTGGGDGRTISCDTFSRNDLETKAACKAKTLAQTGTGCKSGFTCSQIRSEYVGEYYSAINTGSNR